MASKQTSEISINISLFTEIGCLTKRANITWSMYAIFGVQGVYDTFRYRDYYDR